MSVLVLQYILRLILNINNYFKWFFSILVISSDDLCFAI